jgi:hypothetical protein
VTLPKRVEGCAPRAYGCRRSQSHLARRREMRKLATAKGKVTPQGEGRFLYECEGEIK